MNVHENIGDFFNRPRHQIVVDLLEYFLHTEQRFTFENECQALTAVQVDDTEISSHDEQYVHLANYR